MKGKKIIIGNKAFEDFCNQTYVGTAVEATKMLLLPVYRVVVKKY